MKRNVKSSITLPADELRLVLELKKRLHLASNVDVVRAGLRALKERSDRQALREAYRRASLATRGALPEDLEELDHLAGEGLDEP